MKKIISLLMVACMMIGMFAIMPISIGAVDNVWDGTTATAFAGGDGTANNPYQIANGAQLALMRDKVNDGTANTTHFKLTADITLNADINNPTNNWTPIGVSAASAGDQSNPFKGSFDGDGKTITGLYVKYEGRDGTGLFAVLEEATVRNFALIDAHVESPASANACTETGGLVAYVKGKGATIDSVYVSATVEGSDGNVGGLVGIIQGSASEMTTITNCVFAGSIKGTKYLGGIVGNGNNATLTVKNCLNLGDINGTGSHVSGIVGLHQGGNGNGKACTIENCISIGSVKEYGIVDNNKSSYKDKVTLNNCYYMNSTKAASRNATETNVNAIAAITEIVGEAATVNLVGWVKRANDVMIPASVAGFAMSTVEIYAQKVSVKWMNGDVELASEEYNFGDVPEYKGETPTKAEDDTYTYTFSGWSPTLAAVTADTTYVAEFYKTRKNVAIEEDETEAHETTAAHDTTETAEEEKGGCGSMIGGGAVALVAVLGSAVAFGKKKED